MTAALSDCIAIVTGGASGLGAGIARRFCSDGARVMIADVDEAGGKALAVELGSSACFGSLDVRNESNWMQVIQQCQTTFGGFNVLVNNAGVSKPGSIVDTTEESWREALDVNCTGVFFGCKHAVTSMSAKGGAIVNIASARGRRISPNQLSYSCSKALVLRLTEGVALHCAELRLPIRCNAVCPGVIDTPILAPFYEKLGGREAALEHFGSFNAIGRLGTVEELASAVAYLASADASFITGTILDVDGGFRIRDR